MADGTLVVPAVHPVLQPSLGVVPLQLFAYVWHCKEAAILINPETWPRV